VSSSSASIRPILPHDAGGHAARAGRGEQEKLLQQTRDRHKTGGLTDKRINSRNDRGPSVPITMYTTTWCGFCKNLKRQLGRAGIELTEVDIEHDPAAAEFVMSVNGGNQTVPTLLFADGSTLCNPSAAQVQKKLAQLVAIAAD
jgi:mycoredoxin